MLKTKRIYETSKASDGTQFLVERLWPRGMKKENVKMKAWLKDVAPSDSLRRWYAHDVIKWQEFERRYRAELEANTDSWKPVLEAAQRGDVTLLYSARDKEHNSALVLRSFLDEQMRKG
jgi:uncharacterized protein YeaO (DUF488 family)